MRSTAHRALISTVFGFATLGLALAPSVARAQDDLSAADEEEEEAKDKDYRFEFGLYGGYHFFEDKHHLRLFDNNDEMWSPRDGGAFGGRLTLNFNPYVGVEGDGWWTPTRTRRTLGVQGSSKIFVFGYRASLIVNFVGSGPFRPFILLGAGGLSSIVDDPALNFGDGATRMPGDQDPVLHGGFGFKIYFGQRAGMRVDGIVMAPPAFASKVVKIGNETAFHGPDYQVLGSLFFNFSEVEKSSRQVIVKKETVVMQPPPPPPPPAPTDPDGDGISGDADKCPNLAEDRDGFEDQDGCPEADNDQDGIPDSNDKCPLKPENKNDIDDDDGCPEEDGDSDGFIGTRDKCPDAPETKNGYQDNDGCPDEIPQEIKKFTGVIEGINFKSGSATILPGSFSILDRAVKVLQEFPDIKLEIQGHTDNRGRAEYNLNLSQRRADAVRNYFIGKGVNGDRIMAVGYGMERPIADNDTDYGRSKNRRTEFRLVSGQ